MVKDSHDREEPRRPGRVVVEQQRRLYLLPCESTGVRYRSGETVSLRKRKGGRGSREYQRGRCTSLPTSPTPGASTTSPPPLGAGAASRCGLRGGGGAGGEGSGGGRRECPSELALLMGWGGFG